jgi:ssDNA-binding Zn-finger/Zn-ribbon topoisomerase 1
MSDSSEFVRISPRVRISLNEMKGVLEGGSVKPEWLLKRDEIVAKWLVKDTPLAVLVYTSVDQRTGWSRPVGEDAIRTCLIDDKRQVGIGKTQYTQRTTGWQARLTRKVGEMFKLAKEEMAWRARQPRDIEKPYASGNPQCPKCMQPMVKRTNRTTGSLFWGCRKYPNCNGIRKFEDMGTPAPQWFPKAPEQEVQKPLHLSDTQIAELEEAFVKVVGKLEQPKTFEELKKARASKAVW